jgi:hypothetical protein
MKLSDEVRQALSSGRPAHLVTINYELICKNTIKSIDHHSRISPKRHKI